MEDAMKSAFLIPSLFVVVAAALPAAAGNDKDPPKPGPGVGGGYYRLEFHPVSDGKEKPAKPRYYRLERESAEDGPGSGGGYSQRPGERPLVFAPVKNDSGEGVKYYRLEQGAASGSAADGPGAGGGYRLVFYPVTNAKGLPTATGAPYYRLERERVEKGGSADDGPGLGGGYSERRNASKFVKKAKGGPVLVFSPVATDRVTSKPGAASGGLHYRLETHSPSADATPKKP
jgi:hypothetical protein